MRHGNSADFLPLCLRIKSNTESLGEGTTNSVVTAITVVIIIDAIFAIIFSNVGLR